MWPTPRAANPGSRIESRGGKVLEQEARNSQQPDIDTDLDHWIATHSPADPSWWDDEPPIPRLTKGEKHRVAKLKALGNAIVPLQAAVAVGLRIFGGEIGHKLRGNDYVQP